MSLCVRLHQCLFGYAPLVDEPPLADETPGAPLPPPRMVPTPAEARAVVEAAEQRQLAKYEAFYARTVVPCMRDPTWRKGYDSLMHGDVHVYGAPDYKCVDWLQARLAADNPEWIIFVKPKSNTCGEFNLYIHLTEKPPRG